MHFDKILIVGCSYTAGFGLPNEKNNPNIWASQLARKLKASTVSNVSVSGANNQWIFLETMSELIKDSYDLVLVQWSAIPRYKFQVGLELYSVDSLLNQDVNLVANQTITKEWLLGLKSRLLKIHNDHWDLLDLVKYVNTLIEIQVTSRHKHIFFINGLCPWPDRYFVKKSVSVPTELDKFTCNLLQADLRDDVETFQLYDMIHDHYSKYGTIQENRWLNLYQSMDQLKVDTISATDTHPGINSQNIFAEYFYQQIQQKIK